MSKPTYVNFNHKDFVEALSTRYDFRGETGVLSYRISKRVSAHWAFRTPEIAKESAAKILELCNGFLCRAKEQIKNGSRVDYPIYNFLRADVCRKFLLMGYTRSMRYYRHRSGRKWGVGQDGYYVLKENLDPPKLESANYFEAAYANIIESSRYRKLREWYKLHITEIEYNKSRL